MTTIRNLKCKLNSQAGLTLPEMLISLFILVLAFSGLIITFIRCTELTEIARHSSMALNSVQSRMMAIENTDFANISSTYNNTTFTDSDLNGIGITYVDSSNVDYLIITISFSWREKNGRVVGDDADLDGQIDSGEDPDGNNQLDSPVKISTSIYNI